ncbi:hypothetical protein [Neobacillus sp.]|uniref:hypothetical protein n=1 Tax=Neobacillus sp. TaxID=2675273 RepID=UPI0035B54A36
MKKALLAILTLLLIGGTGYFVYSKVGNSKSTTTKIKEKEISKTETTENSKQVQKEKKKKESNNWNGEWTRVSVSDPGTLKISNFNGKTFDLALEVLSGANTGGIDGKATVTGKTAILVNDEFNCRLDLTLNKDSITVNETEGCYEIGGIGTHFGGEYKNQSAAAKTPKATLSSGSIIDANSDKDIQKLLGNDYDTLVENMQIIDSYELEDTLVFEGGVRGLYTLKEGIIVKDPFNHYYIGSIINDGEKVKFYTNDITYKNKLHPVVDEWRQDFADYPVEYIYKKID